MFLIHIDIYMDFFTLYQYLYVLTYMENLNEELKRIKKLMLFESSEVKDDTETDTEETEDVTNDGEPGDKNFIVHDDTTIKVSGGWLKDNKNRIGCVKVARPWILGGSFAQGIKKLIQRLKGNVVAKPQNAISLYDEIEISKSEKEILVKKWNKNEIFVKEQAGVEIHIGRTEELKNFCKKDWGN
jgi:hypothetical protein